MDDDVDELGVMVNDDNDIGSRMVLGSIKGTPLREVKLLSGQVVGSE